MPVYPSGGRYVRDLACATGVALLGWFIALVSVLIVALLVTLLGRSMFWYTHFYASICLYGAAATGKMILVHTLAKNLYFGVSQSLLHSYKSAADEPLEGVSSSRPVFLPALVFFFFSFFLLHSEPKTLLAVFYIPSSSHSNRSSDVTLCRREKASAV